MPVVTIDQRGCRGCTLCVDICPGTVFDLDPATQQALAARSQDCIGCKSCVYVCPSACIDVEEVVVQRPFYRIEQNVAFVERFLQAKTASTTLTRADWDEAYRDITATIVSLSKAISDMMGRGSKAVGRKAGAEGASHLPEMYEESDLPSLMKRLQERFRHAIDFEFETDGESVTMSLAPCRMFTILQGTADKPGEAILCQLFHEYMGGLLRAYTGCQYTCEAPQVGPSCVMKLAPHSVPT